ncbi:MAG: T9SS type A sorting domain-containing protein [Bacteroidia bacterium]|nr:T9SS type A sorting domain-containing protein [Bacteroidia bacterium]
MRRSLHIAFLGLGLFIQNAQSQTVVIEGTIHVDKDWTESSSAVVRAEDGSTGVASRVIFESTSASNVTMNSGSYFYNLEVNKTAGSSPNNYLTHLSDITVNNNLVLTAGILNLNSKSMVLENSAASAITFAAGTGILAETGPATVAPGGGTPSSGYGYVKWKTKSATGNYIVPFIKSAGNDVRLRYQITNAGDASGQINFSTYGTPSNNRPWAAGVTQLNAGATDGSSSVANRYYIIEQGTYGTKPKGYLTFKYLTAELDPTINESRLAAQRFNTASHAWGDWLYSHTADVSQKTVTIFVSNPLDYYDSWVLADNGNPLPIELIEFEARANGDHVDLSWITASEINSDYFLVEKTQDGENFSEVTKVDAANFSNNTLNYSAIDPNPFEGLSYYRLKEVDNDGQFEYSELRPVQFSKGAVDQGIEIFPNPNQGDMFNLELKGFEKEKPVLVVVQDIAGRTFYSKITYVESEHSIKLISSDDNLAKGVYLVVASTDNRVYSKKMIVD